MILKEIIAKCNITPPPRNTRYTWLYFVKNSGVFNLLIKLNI